MSDSILVTGGTGMLGAHLLFRLTSEGYPVKATYRNAGKIELTRKIFSFYTEKPDELFKKIEWVEVDLEDIVRLREAMEAVGQVYHCAAVVSFSGKDPAELIHINTLTTANVVNMALDNQVKKLVHVSSVAALGRSKKRKVIDEDSRWIESKENSAYAKSKYQSELEVWRAIEEGLNAVIVNPSIILGPGDWQEGSANMFHKIASGFQFYTHGVNGFVDARDVAKAMTELMESDIFGERFLTVSESKSYKEVFSEIADCLGAPGPSIEAKPWMGAIVWRLSKLKTMLFGGSSMVTRETVRTSYQESHHKNDKIRKRLGFEFRPVSESIRDFCEIYRKDQMGG